MEDKAMKTKKTYHKPTTEQTLLYINYHVMQEQDIFSGGDPKDTGIVISIDEDDSDDGNRINHWTNHLWDD